MALWTGSKYNGILHFITYSYKNLNNGAGNPNVIKNVEHEDRHLSWYFVYYGYSRIERKTHGYI